MTLTVRISTADDLAGVLGVHLRQRGEGDRAPTAGERAAWHESLKRSMVAVAEVDRRVIGTATLTVVPNVAYRRGPSALIEAVVVVPEARRQGVATAMLREVVRLASDAGCDKVQLLSHHRHATDGAHDLYLGLGFEPEAVGFRRYLLTDPG